MYSVQPCSWAQPRVISLCTAICTHHKPQKGALSPSHHRRMGGWHEILPVAWVKSRDGGWREEGAAGGLESDGAQVPKQTYDLNGSNRFLVGNLPWKIDTKLCRVEGQRRGELWSSTCFASRSFNPSIPKYSLFFQHRLDQDLSSLFCTGSNRFDSTIIDVKRSVFLRVEIFWEYRQFLLERISFGMWLICTKNIFDSGTGNKYSRSWYAEV